MANAAVIAGAPSAPSGTSATTGNGKGSLPASTPFVRAAQDHTEPTYDQSLTMTASTQDFPIAKVNAYGYAQALVIWVTSSGGTGGTPVLAADGPWNLLTNIILSEPNGSPIAQFQDGYGLYLANKYGGYRAFNEPHNNGSLSTNVASPGFLLRIPIMLNERSGLGALPNQNQAAPFQVRMTLNASTVAYSTAPTTTLPTVRVRMWLEAFTQPLPSVGGVSNEIVPPAFQTTQFWSYQSYSIPGAGQLEIPLTRVGNYFRNLIFVFRTTAAGLPRTSTIFATGNPMTIAWDTRPLEQLDLSLFNERIYNRYGYFGTAETAGGPDTGVYPYDFCHEFDGQVGHENNDNWLQTLASTRFSISANWQAAGTVTVLTNDINPVGNVFLS